MQSFKGEFLDFAIRQQVLLFGEFKTKAGRLSPYFFNAGLFNDGLSLKRLGEFYAKAIAASGLAFDGAPVFVHICTSLLRPLLILRPQLG